MFIESAAGNILKEPERTKGSVNNIIMRTMKHVKSVGLIMCAFWILAVNNDIIMC